VLLGAFVEASGIVALQTVEQELEKHLSGRQRQWLEPNKQALEKGAQLARA